jgi:hypothetical protein
MLKDNQGTPHGDEADKAIPMTAMPTLDKFTGDQEQPRSEVVAGVSKVEAFNKVLYQSGEQSSYPWT